MSFLIACQRSLRMSTKYCSKLGLLQKAATERYSPVISHQLHLAQICSGYEKNKHPGFDHKNQTLPYPNIEGIKFYDPESSRPHNFKQVKYGEYLFKECAEGFVHVYVQGYQNPRDEYDAAGYGVCFGENHPLNVSGPVERRQSLNHSKLYGFLKAINLIPKDLKIQKLCVCVDDMSLIGFVSYSIPILSENSFRTQTGRLNKDLETTMEINNLLRSRQDITTLRMRYLPCHTGNREIHQAKKIATKAAMEATQLLRYKQS